MPVSECSLKMKSWKLFLCLKFKIQDGGRTISVGHFGHTVSNLLQETDDKSFQVKLRFWSGRYSQRLASVRVKQGDAIRDDDEFFWPRLKFPLKWPQHLSSCWSYYYCSLRLELNEHFLCFFNGGQPISCRKAFTINGITHQQLNEHFHIVV